MKVGQSPSLIRNSVAKVVLPAPFGPAIIRTFFSESVYLAEGFACLTSLVGEHFTLTLRGLTGVGISQFVIPS